MHCPRCESESTHPDYCSSCGAPLREMPAAPEASRPRRGVSPALLFVGAFIIIQASAWMLIESGSFWRGFGIACASAFLVGLLAGALRLMNPMDADALGEPLHIPSTLPGRETPVLVVSLVIGMAATPIAGLLFYLFFAYARSCLDSRVIAIFGLAIGLQSGAMLPTMVVGWAFSSFFRSGAW